MIIIYDRKNQLCNRIWSYAPFITYCIEKNNKLLILFFGEYLHYFENTNAVNGISFLQQQSRLKRLVMQTGLALLKVIPDFILSPFRIYILKKAKAKEISKARIFDSNKNIAFVSAWNQHAHTVEWNLLQHKDILHKIFLPAAAYTNRIDSFMRTVRKQYDIIIGVHIRRGDYLKFKNGAYFFDDATYLSFLISLKQQLTDKKVGFLLCSNEKPDLQNYATVHAFAIDNAAVIEDLYALCKCDYIIGPPSTFSMWASFYGDVPLHFVYQKDMSPSLSDFSKIVAQNRFENGTTLAHVE